MNDCMEGFTQAGCDASNVRTYSPLFSTVYGDYGRNGKCRHRFLRMWSSMCRNRLYLTNPLVLSASECCETTVSVWNSMIQHGKAKIGVFVSPNFGKKVVAMSYYVPLVYADSGRELRSK